MTALYWRTCVLHEGMNYYLTRKLRAMVPGFFEKSCSRTLRSICNHLHWPLQKANRVKLHTSAPSHVCTVNIHSSESNKLAQFTYLSSKKASPKNSFSLRLKWEDTKSRSSYDSSLGCGGRFRFSITITSLVK